jgi:hypothetical protein
VSVIAEGNCIVPQAVRIRETLRLGVIPVVEKIPRIKHWQRGGLKALDSIEKVFGRLDHVADKLAIGIPTGFPLEGGGYLLVMDVDARNGGEEALAKLPPLPKTVMAQTNDGYHYWFRTDKPFPSTTRPDGIELKGAGAYVVVPPAPGRFWLRDPFDYEIGWAPEWLLAKPTEPVSQTEKRSREVITTWHKPLTGEVGILCKPYLSPVPGQRRVSLLRLAGSWNYKGWTSKEHMALVTNAALQAGIEQKEADRIISYAFNPTPKATVKEAGKARGAYIRVVTHKLSFLDKKVLLVALDCFRRKGQRIGKYEHLRDAWSEVISCRYVASRTGYDQMSAARALRRLVEAGMLWRSRKLRRLKSGAAYQYRPTFIGVAFAEQQLGVDPRMREKPMISLAEEFPQPGPSQ